MTAPTITSARAPEADLSHAGVNEPSMEDILASIRRIIAEDQSSSLGRTGLGGLTRRIATADVPHEKVSATPSAVTAEPVEAEPVSTLSDELSSHAYDAPSDTVSSFAHEDIEEEPVSYQEPEPAYEAVHETTTMAMPEHPVVHDVAATDLDVEPLMSPATGASISSSFQTLAESVMLQDPGLIERVMRDSMRPLLKAWLDDHLPSIVERLVRAEIERVARGGRARNT